MIVVTGEALIDLVPQPGSERPGSERPGPEGPEPEQSGSAGALAALTPKRGGGPYNTAVALGRLGERTAFLSRVSRDAFGEELLTGLRAAGVDVSYVQRGAEPTALAVASVGPDGSAGYSFYVDGTADRLFAAPAQLPYDTRAVSFGTCSLVLEPGASAYEEVLHRTHARGLCTALDPNIRPGLIPDPAAYRARFHSWLASTTLVKLSDDDSRWLGGDPASWLGQGPSAVVVTRGAAGLTAFTRAGEVTVPGVPVDVADTIGAGDTVNAALLHRLSAHDALDAASMTALSEAQWRDILSFAARAAAVTVSRAGAEPPYAHELG
ncbi:carbohydrate kinase family protein [Streptomyces endophyticus]|uniref:Carbohydrate kinase n=1 Tax=Streptomyces endophyticus TaxID=714166 RepID=A0ABU6FD22_9ACTN|nr:carbohydrate kinase [Streptomyces endophyticus]MEB8341931.1 carbohydrate kinase [Streptomyces endophyticus]